MVAKGGEWLRSEKEYADYTADGRYMLVSCEFGSSMIVVDVLGERVVKSIPLRTGASPQDVKLSPDGQVFYVADLNHGGLWEISPRSFSVIGFLVIAALYVLESEDQETITRRVPKPEKES